MKSKIAIGVLICLILIQFVPVDTHNPSSLPEKDFIVFNKAPQEVAQVLKTSCYDCHSFETVYPWYFNIAPVSWWLKHHINEGREKLNFSIWGDYDDKRKIKKTDESIKMIDEGEMPMWSYTLAHKEAAMDQTQKKIVMDWLKTIK